MGYDEMKSCWEALDGAPVGSVGALVLEHAAAFELPGPRPSALFTGGGPPHVLVAIAHDMEGLMSLTLVPPDRVDATLTAALEYLIALDARAGRPLLAALVVSQAGSGLPRAGFFECAAALGACPAGMDEEAARRWHAAELARVLACGKACG